MNVSNSKLEPNKFIHHRYNHKEMYDEILNKIEN